LSALTTNPTMRRMFGQREWKVPLRKYMDEGHICLWDLLNVSQANLKLTMGHLANQYHTTAKRRPENVSRPHLLKIDEAHEVQLPVIPKIIYEDRKFGLSLGLITQFANQLNSDIVAAISEVAGTVMSCYLGSDSAAKVSKMTNGAFEPSYLQNLPERVTAVYTQVEVNGRKEVTTFTVKAPPPVVFMPSGIVADYKNGQEMIQAQNWGKNKGLEIQKRDWIHADQIDSEISEYMKTGTVKQVVKQINLEKMDETSSGQIITSSAAPKIIRPSKIAKNGPAEMIPLSKIELPTNNSIPTDDDDDDLYKEALSLVLETKTASVSALQRRFRIGFTRAARIIALLENNGVIGPYEGDKPREILITSIPETREMNETKRSSRLLIPKE
jgi:Ftsk gamma domain